MKFSKQEVLHVAKLARISMTEEEMEAFSKQLSDILKNFEILNQVDTTGIPPTTQPNPQPECLKEDTVKPSMSREDVLANAPAREGEFIKIRPVLG